MTAHSQDDIISFGSERNNPAWEITRNAIIIELDTKWKTKFFASTAYSSLLPPQRLLPAFWSHLLDTGNGLIFFFLIKMKTNQLQRFPKRQKLFICTAAASKPNFQHQLEPTVWDFSSSGHECTCSEQQSRLHLFSLSLGECQWSHLPAAVQTTNPETHRHHVNFVASFL